MFLFYIQVTTVVYQKKSFKKNLWKQKVGRSKLIKNRSANDRQYHVCPEMKCSHKSLMHTCNALRWECVYLQLHIY